jgi:hypothetical protein
MAQRPGSSGGGKPRSSAGTGKTADPEQYQRFLEAARELGCEENAERMEEVIKRAAKLLPGRSEGSRPTRVVRSPKDRAER